MALEIRQNLVTLENSSPSVKGRVAICNHIMDGFMGGTYTRFNNPKEQVSAHFGNSKTGTIVQYVSLDRWAYANGILEPTPDLSVPFIKYCWDHRNEPNPPNPNWYTFSIENEGRPGDIMPEAQYQSLLALHIYLIARNPAILVDREHIIGHSQISPRSRLNCPGPNFPWQRLLTDLRKEFPMATTIPAIPGNFAARSEFRSFYWQHGGLQIFGLPISPELPGAGFGKATAIQWFERARFELQPDGSVFLGLVGWESYREGPAK